jgi:hypothetical protein
MWSFTPLLLAAATLATTGGTATPVVENAQVTTAATGVTRTLPSFVVGNHTDRVLLAFMASYSSSEPHETHDSVVFNTTEGFTKVADVLQGNNDFRVTMWRLLNPTVTTANIVATASGSISQALMVLSLYDVDQTTPLGTPATDTALTGEPSITFAGVAADLGIDCSLSEYGVTGHGAGQTENAIENTGWGFTSSRKAGGTSITMTETLSNAGASWEAIGVAVKGVSTGGGYSMDADAGSFALTGVAAALLHAAILPASAGTFVETGNAAGLNVGRVVSAEVGVFTETGIDAILQREYVLASAVGSFSLSGQTVGLEADRILPAEVGAFTLSGQSASLSKGVSFPVEVGTFTLTGQDAAFSLTRVLGAGVGNFSLTGQAAGLTAGKSLSASPGSFALSGVDASLKVGRVLQADAGTFTEAGQDAGLLRGAVLAAGTGTFTETGIDAGLVRAYNLAASVGAFSLTGIAAELEWSGGQAILDAEVGAFALTGQSAGLTVGRNLATETGSFVHSGQEAGLAVGRVVVAQTGAFTFSGIDAALTKVGSLRIEAETGVFILTGKAADYCYNQISMDVGDIQFYSGGRPRFTSNPRPVFYSSKRSRFKSPKIPVFYSAKRKKVG